SRSWSTCTTSSRSRRRCSGSCARRSGRADAWCSSSTGRRIRRSRSAPSTRCRSPKRRWKSKPRASRSQRSTNRSPVSTFSSSRSHGRVRDAELLEVRLVLRRIEVILLHLVAVPVDDLLVQIDRRLILVGDERDVLLVLRLHVAEVVPRAVDELGA